MRRESAMDIVARHFLIGANGRFAAATGVAGTAGNHGGDDDGAVLPPDSIRSGIDDMTADLVSEGQRQFMFGADPVVVVTEIGVANAASGNFDDHLARSGRRIELGADERSARARHQPSDRSIHCLSPCTVSMLKIVTALPPPL